jgi:hypothetical protein
LPGNQATHFKPVGGGYLRGTRSTVKKWLAMPGGGGMKMAVFANPCLPPGAPDDKDQRSDRPYREKCASIL